MAFGHIKVIVLRAQSISSVKRHILRESATNYYYYMKHANCSSEHTANFSEYSRLLAYIRKKSQASRQQIYYSGTSMSTSNNIFKHINISRTNSEISKGIKRIHPPSRKCNKI